MKLVFSNGHGIAECRRGSWELSALPAFSFACDGYWLYRLFIPIGSHFLELFFGWNLFGGNDQGRCKVACQIRGRTSAN